MKQEGGERLEALRKKLRDDPRSLAFVELAEELIRIGSHAEAADVANRGLLSHPDSVAGRLALAVAEAEQDHIREALEQIKRALLIDQENPKALALMGGILLKKGLAKRAVQFLTHAVKLAPKEEEYGELLREARMLSKSSQEGAVPVFDGSNVPESANPWEAADGGSLSSESEHTVFDPDALKKIKKKPPSKSERLDQALSNLPSVDDAVGEEEPTKFHHRQGGSIDEVEEIDEREEPTKFAAESPQKDKKAKMGGSALEYSRIMRKAEGEASAPKPPPPPMPSEPDPEGRTIDAPRPPEKEVRPPPKAPSVERSPKTSSLRARVDDNKANEEKKEEKAEKPEKKEEKAEAPEKVDSKAEKAKVDSKAEKAKVDSKAAKPEKAETPVDKPPKPEKPAKAEKPEKKEEAAAPPPPQPDSKKQVAHVATRMVDEALWALLGGKGAEPEGKRPEPDPKPKAKVDSKAEKSKEAKEEPAAEAQARPGGPMVVRTSERFGTWTGIAVLLILCVAALWTGYAIAIASRGPGPETSGEELKGIATDLERGGLAAMLAAEEKIAELERINPSLEVLLSGALAESYARRWADFGRDAKMLEKARAEIQQASADRPTIELLTAMTLVSSSASSLASIDAELVRSAVEYKDSPKIWVLRAKVAQLDGRPDDVPLHLYRAYAINPQHRLTLLELARWHAKQGAYGTAFSLFDQMQARYSVDVEVAIERYVLGQITGKDPNEAQAISTLAGLVREEIPEVAKDEAGRAALAFAGSKLAKGDVVEGLEELSKADAAFQDSAVFKSAVAGVYLSMGEWSPARELYSRALEIEPDNEEHRFGLARATLLERSGRKVIPEDEKKKMKDRPSKNGVADLPFGTVRFELAKFELVTVEPDASFFPEGEYRSLAKQLDGKDLTKALEAASLRMLARLKSREGKHEEAINLLKESLKLADDPSSEYALALIHRSKKDWDEAEKLLKKAAAKNEDPAVRLALARVYLGKGEDAKALSTLDQIDGVIAPDALLIRARLKIERDDYEGAIDQLQKLGAMLPKNQTVQILHGEALDRLGRNAEADAAYARALAIQGRLLSGDPPAGLEKLSSVALVGLGRVEVKQNRKRGLAILRAAEKKEGVPASVHFHLGEALFAKPMTQKSGRKKLERYLELVESGELRERAEELLKKK